MGDEVARSHEVRQKAAGIAYRVRRLIWAIVQCDRETGGARARLAEEAAQAEDELIDTIERAIWGKTDV